MSEEYVEGETSDESDVGMVDVRDFICKRNGKKREIHITGWRG